MTTANQSGCAGNSVLRFVEEEAYMMEAGGLKDRQGGKKEY